MQPDDVSGFHNLNIDFDMTGKAVGIRNDGQIETIVFGGH